MSEYEIDYEITRPGWGHPEELYDKVKAKDIETAIRKVKNQKNWAREDRHPKAKIRIVSIIEVGKSNYREYADMKIIRKTLCGLRLSINTLYETVLNLPLKKYNNKF